MNKELIKRRKKEMGIKRKLRNKKKVRRFITRISIIILFIVILTKGCSMLISGKDSKDKKVEKNKIEIGGELIQTKEVDVNNVEDTRELWLINQKNLIDEYKGDSIEEDLELVSTYGKMNVKSSNILVNENAFENLEKWMAYGEEVGFNRLILTSSYRSFEEQKETYKNAKDKSYVQAPGGSEHNLGLSVDIMVEGITEEELADKEEGKWLVETAPDFGFVLRYPSDKTSITDISFEPWHFRYVGKIHAKFMSEQGFTLEEYLSFLENTKGVKTKNKDKLKSTEKDKQTNKNYIIYYDKEEKGKISVPKDKKYTVSKDNRGGYVVTVLGIKNP